MRSGRGEGLARVLVLEWVGLESSGDVRLVCVGGEGKRMEKGGYGFMVAFCAGCG